MNARNRTLAALAALFALILAVGSPAVAANVDADEVNRSIVWVDTEFSGVVTVPVDDGAGGVIQKQFPAVAMGYCTGWFASTNGHVATAGHCLEANRGTAIGFYDYVIRNNQLNIGDLRIQDLDWSYTVTGVVPYIKQPSVIEDNPFNGEDRAAQIIDHQPFTNGDNALLKIAGMTNTPALPISSVQPSVGEEVTAIGYAGSVARAVDVNRQPPSYKEGSVSSLSTSSSGVPHTEIDAAITQGMSGGPTLNEQGEVVGINSFMIVGENQPFNFITDTETMRTFLQSNGVDVAAGNTTDVATSDEATNDAAPEPATDVVGSDSEANSSTSTATTIIVAVLATLVIVAIGVIVFLVKKARSQQGNASNSPSASS